MVTAIVAYLGVFLNSLMKSSLEGVEGLSKSIFVYYAAIGMATAFPKNGGLLATQWANVVILRICLQLQLGCTMIALKIYVLHPHY